MLNEVILTEQTQYKYLIGLLLMELFWFHLIRLFVLLLEQNFSAAFSREFQMTGTS